MAKNNKLIVSGAKEHNLKDVSIEIPRGKMTVFCGLSGSGKSSLAFDTIFAEGQRRYVESLSAYARQFLGQLDKPDVDSIEGLSPAVSIDQKSTSKNPRSTVGTVTEIWDYLRLLWARVGTPHCVKCGREVRASSATEIADFLLSDETIKNQQVLLLAPVVRDRKGSHESLWPELSSKGYTRARTDGEIHRLSAAPKLERYEKHQIDVIVDRMEVTPSKRSRLVDGIEAALKLSEGYFNVASSLKPGEEGYFADKEYSEHLACPHCKISIGELEPRSFSFNSPYGACAACAGLGSHLRPDTNLIVPDDELSLNQGAIAPWAGGGIGGHWSRLLEGVANHYRVSMDTPWKDLPDDVKETVLNGSKDIKLRLHWNSARGAGRMYDTTYEGVKPWLLRSNDRNPEGGRDRIEGYMRSVPCPVCNGARLKPEALAVSVDAKSIAQVADMTIEDLSLFFKNLKLSPSKAVIGERVQKEICERLTFLKEVGLTYLTLSRGAITLSGGEAQRIRLATQIGSGLTGVLYVLDEPSIGLHQRDNRKLINTLVRLRDLGNTLIVVEHDEETIEAADWVVDIGPRAGEHGGEVVYCGNVKGLSKARRSITGDYLSGKRKIPTPASRRPGNGQSLEIIGVNEHNCTNLDVSIPLGKIVAVTGVSGSGKSTVVNDVLANSLTRALHRAQAVPGEHRKIMGMGNLDKAVIVDQSPIGRTPRSNPATYTGVFDKIRTLFSETQESKVRGYGPGRFSFNIKGGRCESCSGDGTLRVEMNFLPDVYVPCEVCRGKRYNRETLEVLYKGKNISQVLEMTIEEGLEFFSAVSSIKRYLSTLVDVGLGYVKLGQPATTLSGGEAQRVKLASELQRRSTGKTVYILDEPTTGLHFEDVKKLLEVLHKLADSGNSVILIEHNLDVIRNADWVIDMGPEGGPGGGQIVAAGTPEEVAENKNSHTGEYLKEAFEREKAKSVTHKNNHKGK